MEAHVDEEANHGVLSGEIDGGAASAWGSTADDGGPTPADVKPPAQARPFDAKNVPCLRNCRYYFRAVTAFDHGNPAGTFKEGYEPTQRHHACSALAGVYLELSADSPVYECTNWDPVKGDELKQIAARRGEYFAAHPDHEPEEDERVTEEDPGNGAASAPS